MRSRTHLPTPTHTSAPGSAARSSPEVIRCETPADFLAALPRLVGFTAQDSLFIVLFAGSRARGALRVDLPKTTDPPDRQDYFDELESCLRRAQRLHGRDAPALVISSSLSFAASGGTPWQAFAAELTRRLSSAGQRPRELCCLAPDGWVSFFDPAPPRFGRPLSEIAASPAAGDSVPALTDLGEFRRVPDAELREVGRALAAANVHSQESLATSAAMRSETARLFIPGALSPAESARLLIALGSDAGWACVFDTLAATAAALPDPSVPGADAAPPDELVSSREAHGALARLSAVSEHLAFLAPLAPQHTRVSVMSLCALAWWTRGLESVAHRQIRQAVDLDPEHEVARLTLRVITLARAPAMPRAGAKMAPGA